MRFHVLGLGPIGSLLSYHLRRALPPTHSITLIRRTESQARDALSNGGAIHVESQGLVSSASGFHSEVFEAPNEPSRKSRGVGDTTRNQESKIIESLFVTTKAQQTLPAIQRLLPRLSGNTTIVLLQNGMGIYEELVHKIFRNPDQRPHFILATNTHGAFRKSTYTFVHAGQGAIDFGIMPDHHERDFEAGFSDEATTKSERKPRLADITPSSDDPMYVRYRSLRTTVAALLLAEDLNVSWKPIAQIQTAMRRKLVVNSVINPLTALMGCRNGDIFSTVESRRIMQRVCQEASDVFAAQLRAESQTWLDSLIPQGIDPKTVSVGRLPLELTRPMLEEEVKRVAQATRGNISSMLTDIRTGRATEVDFLNGYLVKLGATYRVDMPATATLRNLIKMRASIPLDQML